MEFKKSEMNGESCLVLNGEYLKYEDSFEVNLSIVIFGFMT